jgi:YegS/Rv2252/BmrU family lipid kinase
VHTTAKGHGAEVARDLAARGVRYVVAVGGDGTAHEVVQHLVAHPSVTFGLVPAGTGNDLVELFGFPARFEAADWETFFSGHAIAMDVGRCNERFFLNGMGLGMDARVAAENYVDAAATEVKRGHRAKYLWHIVKTLVTYQEHTVQVTRGGVTDTRRLFLNAINIGRRVAGGLYLTPEALSDDGLFDVCWVEELGLAARLYELMRVMAQAHVGDARVEIFRTERLTFEFDDEVPAHLDGEVIHARRFEVDLVPRALSVLHDPSRVPAFSGAAQASKSSSRI